MTITAIENDLDAPDRHVIVSGRVQQGSGVADPDPVELRINDNDPAPRIVLVAAPAPPAGSFVSSFSENGGTATVTARSIGRSVFDTTIALRWELQDQFAGQELERFIESGNNILVVPAGTESSLAADPMERSQTITAIDDHVPGPDKPIIVFGDTENALYGSGCEGGCQFVPALPVDLIIVEDDPDITLSVMPYAVIEGDTKTVTVTASFPDDADDAFLPEDDTIVTVAVDSGTATRDEDFGRVNGFNIRIPAGEARAKGSFELRAIVDALTEDDETVAIGGDAGGLEVRGTTVTIRDATPAPTDIVLSATPYVVTEGETRTVTVTASFSSVLREDATIVAVTVTGGDAKEGEDFDRVNGFDIRIPAGEASAEGSFELRAIVDALTEDDETVAIGGVARGIEVRGTTVTILDATPAPTDIVLSVSPGAVAEHSGTTEITVTASFADGETAPDDTDVTVTVADGTAEGGVDFKRVTPPFPVTIPAGENDGTAVFLLTVIDDEDQEEDESVTVTGAATAFTVGGMPTVTIEDDDATPVPPPAPTDIVLSVAPGAVAEGSGTTEITVTASFADGETAPDDTDVTVTVADGTANSGVDFERVTPFPITIPANTADGEATFLLTVIDDEDQEEDESVTVTGAATAFTVGGMPVVMIEDDDGDIDDANLMPELPTIPDQEWTVGEEIEPLALPEAEGGDAPLIWELTPEIERYGLDYDDETRTISGTPDRELGRTPFTIEVTDDDGDASTSVFHITIHPAPRPAPAGPSLARVNETILPELARAYAENAADAAENCLDERTLDSGAGDAAPNGGAARTATPADMLSSFARTLKANERALREGDWRQALSGESFALGLAEGGPGGADVVVCGGGKARGLSLDDRAVDWGGEMFAGHLGAVAALGDGVRAGAAVSWSDSRIDYIDRSRGAPASGVHESRMTGFHPFMWWALPDGSRLWVTVGVGGGEIEIDDGQTGDRSSDSTLLTTAVGGRTRLSADGAMTLHLKGEAHTARLDLDGDGGPIAGMTASAHRAHLTAEGSRVFALAAGATLTPSAELGLRYNGGEGAQGAGVELGGTLAYNDPVSGLTAEVAGGGLAAHARGLREWRMSALLRLNRSTDGLGLILGVAPSWGTASSRIGGPGAALAAVAAGRETNDNAPAGRIEATAGYGFAALGGALTPEAGVALADDGARRYFLGGRLGFGEGIHVGLAISRRERRAAASEHGVHLAVHMRW